MTSEAARAGRPTRLTPEIQHKIITIIQNGQFMLTAARAVNLHVNTIKQWIAWGTDEVSETGGILKKGREPYRTFRMEFEQASALVEIESLKNLRQGRNGWKAEAWFLQRRFPDRWKEKRSVEMTGPGGKEIPPMTPTINLILSGTGKPAPWKFGEAPDDADDPDTP